MWGFQQASQTRNVEILKLRFGEAALQLCDVMLKDVADSRRIDKHMASRLNVSCYNTYTNIIAQSLPFSDASSPSYHFPPLLAQFTDIIA